MEAANRGAHDAGAASVGSTSSSLRSRPNPYITPGRLVPLPLFRPAENAFPAPARALVAFPGGFGTFDELFEALTLVQPNKIARIPIVLVGSAFWRRASISTSSSPRHARSGRLELFSVVRDCRGRRLSNDRRVLRRHQCCTREPPAESREFEDARRGHGKYRGALADLDQYPRPRACDHARSAAPPRRRRTWLQDHPVHVDRSPRPRPGSRSRAGSHDGSART